MLKFSNEAWRFENNSGHEPISSKVIDEFFELIKRMAGRGKYQAVLEDFKSSFSKAMGASSSWSSDSSWAETDLHSSMREAAENPPLFIEAFYDSCEAYRGELPVPDVARINRVLTDGQIPFRIEPPNLVGLNPSVPQAVIEVPPPPPSLAARGHEVMEASLRRSEALLAEGKAREAVQEVLFLLESVSTAFRGVETQAGEIGGSYFNDIVKELRQGSHGQALNEILGWLSRMHGYLSAPAGGGVRHGLDLDRGVAVTVHEARLYCNLTRSYIGFLLSEHERMVREGVPPRRSPGPLGQSARSLSR